ncbi:MAG TPA: glycerophosphodiester phosphodiesterase family protein [Candidatus Lumbricidophila sp.]|nr:glycerophosphodiester phosphodiesterase family protein [Candidatus Lumbricidophila sp.]
MTVAYLSGPLPRVLAHRGLALEVPENTLAAFAAALAMGATYLETDVHLSRDGVAMISHDLSLMRVAGRDELVSAHSATELAAVDLGLGHGMPTLADALEQFPTARFNIDLKTDDVVAPAVATVRALDAVDRVLLTSFSEARRRRAGQLLHGAGATSTGVGGVLRLKVASLLPRFVGASGALAGAVAVQVPERNGPLQVVTPRFIRAAHAAGAEVHVWTVNERADMWRLLALGVDGLVTDRADLAVDVVEEWNRSRNKREGNA